MKISWIPVICVPHSVITNNHFTVTATNACVHEDATFERKTHPLEFDHEAIDFANGIWLSCEATDSVLSIPLTLASTCASPWAIAPSPPPPTFHPSLSTSKSILQPQHREKIRYKKVSNQKAQGREINMNPKTRIQDGTFDSGRTMYSTRHPPPMRTHVNKIDAVIHINVRPELRSGVAGICFFLSTRWRSKSMFLLFSSSPNGFNFFMEEG